MTIIIWKFQSQNIQYQTILIPDLGIFIFVPNFGIWQIRGCWFYIWQKFWEIAAHNNQIRNFWTQIEEFLFLYQAFEKCKSTYFEYGNSFRQNVQKFEVASNVTLVFFKWNIKTGF